MSFPRYPKYKDSGVEWLGEVPEHWEVKRLKVISTHNDDVLDETTSPETGIVYVDISGVGAVSGNCLARATCATAPVFARWWSLCSQFSLFASRALSTLRPVFMRVCAVWVVIGNCSTGGD